MPGTGRFDNATQGAQLFALWYDLSPEKEKTFEVLTKEFERHNFHLATGIFSTMMMFDVLPKMNKNELAYRIADQKDFPGWGYMLANDATTLWESWEKPSSSSYNHPMFGSVDEWFYKWLLGIQSAAPGFKKIIIKPQPGELTWAKGSYQSVYGPIKTEWKKSINNFELKVSVPANTTAEIYLPATAQSTITESDKAIPTGAGIQFIRFEKDCAVFAVGSGDYHFIAK